MAMTSLLNPNRRGLAGQRWPASRAECSSKFHFKAMIRTVPRNFLSLSLFFPLPILFFFLCSCLAFFLLLSPGSLFSGMLWVLRVASDTALLAQALVTFRFQPASLPPSVTSLGIYGKGPSRWTASRGGRGEGEGQNSQRRSFNLELECQATERAGLGVARVTSQKIRRQQIHEKGKEGPGSLESESLGPTTISSWFREFGLAHWQLRPLLV